MNLRSINCRWLVMLLLTGWYLLPLTVNAQAGFPCAAGDIVIYYPRLYQLEKATDQRFSSLFQEALKPVAQILDIRSGKTIKGKDIKEVRYFPDRLEISSKGSRNDFVFRFAEFPDSLQFFFGRPMGGNYILFPSRANFAFASQDDAAFFANLIYTKQYPSISHWQEKELATFSTKLQQVTPGILPAAIREQQVSLLNEADSLADAGNHTAAIGVYRHLLQLNAFSYPAAYSNLALLYAHLNQFDQAILQLRKYILLKPYPDDLRKATDKLYEWEIIIRY